MAQWSGNKVDPSNINGGIEYKSGDRLSREAVNAIVNNSIYASEKSDEALEKANSAFMANGTVVSVGGTAQPTLEFESDPQEQINAKQEIETLYDMSSTDENLHWRESGGITNDTDDWVTISGKDFTKYKKLRILAGAMSWSKMYYVLYEVDLTMPFEESGFKGYCGGTVGWTWFENNRLWVKRSVCRVSDDKTSISFKGEFFNTEMVTETRTFIAKIEGVL